MNEPDATDVDRRLRETFGDDDAAAARVARAALAEEGARIGLAVPPAPTGEAARLQRRWAVVAAGAAVLLVASAVVWWPARPLHAPGVEPAAGSGPTLAVEPAVVSAMPKQTSGTAEQKSQLLERMKEALKQPLPASMKFENAPLSEVSARLSEALGLTITLMSENPALRTVNADFSNKTLMTALQDLGSSVSNPPALRLTLSYPNAPGGPVSPSIMLGFKFDSKKK